MSGIVATTTEPQQAPGVLPSQRRVCGGDSNIKHQRRIGDSPLGWTHWRRPLELSKSMTPSPPGAHAATAPVTTGSVGTSTLFGASAGQQEASYDAAETPGRLRYCLHLLQALQSKLRHILIADTFPSYHQQGSESWSPSSGHSSLHQQLASDDVKHSPSWA